MSYVYLASPYSHPNPRVMQERYLAVLEVTAKLLNDGDEAERLGIPKGFV